MNMLAIDTSNQMMGVAIMQDGIIAAEVTTNIKKDHSSRLMPAIVDIMEMVNLKPERLSKIIVAQGPGSYTGTRIGITTAKTMAWALKIPITTISSLELLAVNGTLFDGYICPFFDARRQTVFTGLYEWKNAGLQVVKPEVNMLMEEWLEMLDKLQSPILFLSPNLDLYLDIITQKCQKAVIPESPFHLARPGQLFTLAEGKETSPTHQVAPNYLRITEAEAKLKEQKGESNNG